MKKLFALIVVAVVAASCVQVHEIGHVNIIGTRNFDTSAQYERLATYSGGTKKELRKSKAETIEKAVQNTLRGVVGGEYMTNATIYIVEHSSRSYFAVEGDVYGLQQGGFRGFNIGDEVTYEIGKIYYEGKVIAVKPNDNVIVIKEAKSNVVVEVKVDKVYKK